MRDIGNAGQHFAKLGVEFFHAGSQTRDAVRRGARTLLQLGGIGALFAQPGDLARLEILVGLQLFRFGDGGAAAAVELAIFLYRKLDSARADTSGESRPDGRETPPDHAYRGMLTGALR